MPRTTQTLITNASQQSGQHLHLASEPFSSDFRLAPPSGIHSS